KSGPISRNDGDVSATHGSRHLPQIILPPLYSGEGRGGVPSCTQEPSSIFAFRYDARPCPALAKSSPPTKQSRTTTPHSPASPTRRSLTKAPSAPHSRRS